MLEQGRKYQHARETLAHMIKTLQFIRLDAVTKGPLNPGFSGHFNFDKNQTSYFTVWPLGAGAP